MLIIGIAGGSGSGKTTVVREITQQLKENVVVIPQDSYYKDLGHLSEEEKRVLHHPVTFGDYSTLKIVVGRDKADALAVNGAVDVSATGTRLEIGPIDDVTRLKSGTYTILSAMDGITNEFSEVVMPKRSWKVEKVNARQLDDRIEVYDALTLTVPGSGMLMIVR